MQACTLFIAHRRDQKREIEIVDMFMVDIEHLTDDSPADEMRVPVSSEEASPRRTQGGYFIAEDDRATHYPNERAKWLSAFNSSYSTPSKTL